MTWLQIIAQGAIMATFIGPGIAVAAYFNEKHIKEGIRETRELIEKIDSRADERHRELFHALKLT